jgi:hypothetical protein
MPDSVALERHTSPGCARQRTGVFFFGHPLGCLFQGIEEGVQISAKDHPAAPD